MGIMAYLKQAHMGEEIITVLPPSLFSITPIPNAPLTSISGDPLIAALFPDILNSRSVAATVPSAIEFPDKVEDPFVSKQLKLKFSSA